MIIQTIVEAGYYCIYLGSWLGQEWVLPFLQSNVNFALVFPWAEYYWNITRWVAFLIYVCLSCNVHEIQNYSSNCHSANETLNPEEYNKINQIKFKVRRIKCRCHWLKLIILNTRVNQLFTCLYIVYLFQVSTIHYLYDKSVHTIKVS